MLDNFKASIKLNINRYMEKLCGYRFVSGKQYEHLKKRDLLCYLPPVEILPAEGITLKLFVGGYPESGCGSVQRVVSHILPIYLERTKKVHTAQSSLSASSGMYDSETAIFLNAFINKKMSEECRLMGGGVRDEGLGYVIEDTVGHQLAIIDIPHYACMYSDYFTSHEMMTNRMQKIFCKKIPALFSLTNPLETLALQRSSIKSSKETENANFEFLVKGIIEYYNSYKISSEDGDLLYVKYEGLISDFKKQYSKICDYIDFPASDEMMIQAQKNFYNQRTPEIFSTQQDRWKTWLSHEEIEIARYLGIDEVNSMLGYCEYSYKDIHPRTTTPYVPKSANCEMLNLVMGRVRFPLNSLSSFARERGILEHTVGGCRVFSVSEELIRKFESFALESGLAEHWLRGKLQTEQNSIMS